MKRILNRYVGVKSSGNLRAIFFAFLVDLAYFIAPSLLSVEPSVLSIRLHLAIFFAPAPGPFFDYRSKSS